MLRETVDAPLSPYADAIRSIKLAVDFDKRARSQNTTKVIGITSCFSGEGKSTVAASTAALIARTGARVILVDSDARNPSLTRLLARDASVGFLDVLAGNVTLANALWRDQSTNMAFLPMARNVHSANATDLISSEAARLLSLQLRIDFDYVIVDLAPLISVVDVHAATNFVDSYLLVIEWGYTKVDAVQYALRNVPGIKENIVGAVLNKVDIDTLRSYDSYGAQYYYGRSGPGKLVH